MSLLQELFKTCGKFPQNVAIYNRGEAYLTYEGLWSKANALASKISTFSFQPETIIALSFPMFSPDYVTSILAVWLCECAFVPLDPDLPEERKKEIYQLCQIPLTLTLDHVETTGPVISLSSFPSPDQLELSPPRKFSLNTLAYVIFTSGSTGTPKGVMLEHAGLLSFLLHQVEQFAISSTSRSLVYLSTNFDAHLSDLFAPLVAGASLFFERKPDLARLDFLLQRLLQLSITHVDLPPSLLPALLPSLLPASLQTLVIGGEVPPLHAVRHWAQKLRLVNVYGPTEATVCTSTHRCSPDWSTPLLGLPVPGLLLSVRDSSLRPVLPGQTGELFLSGPALARGYLGLPELTAAKFLFIEGTRFYRTGDAVRLLEDDIEFLGRLDRQFKLNGILIEPYEIERALSRHQGVVQAVVHCVDRRLIASYVGTVDPATLRQWLRSSLPPWLIPARFLQVESLQKTSNEKIDTSHQDWTPTLSLLQGLFKSILNLEQISPDDNLFELGLTSLDLVKAAALSPLLTPSRVYSSPTIRQLCQFSEEEPSDLEEEVQREFATLRRPSPPLHSTPSTPPDRPPAQPPSSSPQIPPPSRPIKVLLTGASGFVGGAIAAQLAKQSPLICLLRSPLSSFPFDYLLVDYALPRLGLSEEAYLSLSSVTHILHCAGPTSVVQPWSSLRPALSLTRVVLQLALDLRAKFFLISSLSASLDCLDCPSTLLESSPLPPPPVLGGYGQSKWACERL